MYVRALFFFLYDVGGGEVERKERFCSVLFYRCNIQTPTKEYVYCSWLSFAAEEDAEGFVLPYFP